MTLEEAIKHAEEKAKYGGKCGEDHAQLAEWLKELKERRAAELEKRTEERTETHACDSISRQAAIKEAFPVRCEGDVYMMVQVETLEGLPSVQPGPRWISCEEMLPEEKQDVLLLMPHNMVVGFWEDVLNDGGRTWYANSGDGYFTDMDVLNGYDDPIAWAPLPLAP